MALRFVFRRKFKILGLVVTFILKSIFATSSQSKTTVLQNFVQIQIKQSFPTCSLVTMLVTNQQNQMDNWSAISSKLDSQASYIYKYGGTAVTASDMQSPKILGKVRRHSNPCVLTLTFINKDFNNFLTEIKNTIAPTFQPLTRMDMDYYMFITSPEYHSELLEEETFVKKIKYKVAVGELDDRIKISALNTFGGENGNSKQIQISSDDSIGSKDALFPDFAHNLNGYELRVSVPPGKSIVEVKPPPWTEKKNAKRGGWKYLFEEYLMIKFNCTYRVFRSTGKDGKFGTGGSGAQLANGSWYGVVGDLYYGRADLGVAIAQTDRRIQYIGYTDAIFDTGCLTFVTDQPVKVYSTLAMFWPFNSFVWAFITCGTLLAFIFFFSVSKYLQHLNLEKSRLTLGLQGILLFAPYTGQGCSTMPNSVALRVFLAFWLFYALVVTTLYQSRLVTLLAFPILGSLPETFEQLAFSDFEVGFMKNGDSAYNTFARSKDPVYAALVGKMELLPGVNLQCLQNVVSRKKYACIAYDFDIEYLHHKNLSDVDTRKLVISNARTYNIWLGLATEANSILRINFCKVLGQTVPSHLAEVWNKMDMHETVRKPKLEWWKETGQTDKLSEAFEENTTNLTLANILGVFYTFQICVFCSILVFLYEAYCSERAKENIFCSNKKTGIILFMRF